MVLEEVALAATAESGNAVSIKYLGVVVGHSKPENPIISAAWTVLEAANDLGDFPTVEACQRVIDANLIGALPEHSDINIIFDFFN